MFSIGFGVSTQLNLRQSTHSKMSRHLARGIRKVQPMTGRPMTARREPRTLRRICLPCCPGFGTSLRLVLMLILLLSRRRGVTALARS